MPLARLLLAAFSLSSLTLFAQDQQGIQIIGPPIPCVRHCGADFSTAAATPGEPWRIVPNDRTNVGSAHDKLNRTQGVIIPLDGEFLAANTCYTIRSYVVARDAKDSDSTHPVKSSTCLPATRYHVKKAELRPDSGNR